MRTMCTFLLASLVLSACAQSVPPAALQASPAATAVRNPIIADAEPEITQQVAATLERLRAGLMAPDEMTDSARAALSSSQLQKMAAALKGCAKPPTLELLSRTTKGEDRHYHYRALCTPAPAMVEIVFNKGGRINLLSVMPE